jgi:hypothetical protein
VLSANPQNPQHPESQKQEKALIDVPEGQGVSLDGMDINELSSESIESHGSAQTSEKIDTVEGAVNSPTKKTFNTSWNLMKPPRK